MSSSTGSTSAQELCERLEGAQFESETKQPCGPPVEGEPMQLCPSVIGFSNGEYEWRVTDMMFAGRYACTDNLVRSIDTDDLKGTLSADATQLTIDGERYHRLQE